MNVWQRLTILLERLKIMNATEFTDDGWGGTGTLHICFEPASIKINLNGCYMGNCSI